MNQYCPLCKSYLLDIGGLKMCRQRVHFSNGYQRSHFEKHGGENRSTWCLPPYLIINDEEKKISKVMITKSYEINPGHPHPEPIWEDLFQTELIAPGDVERLKKRIKALVIFS